MLTKVIISCKYIITHISLLCNRILYKYSNKKERIYMWIFSPYITVKGRRIYASSYGLKVFRFWVDEDKLR